MMQTLYVIIFITWTLMAFQLFPVLGYGVTINDAALAIFYVIVVKKLLWDGITLRYSRNLAVVCLLGIFPAVIFSAYAPIVEGQGFEQYLKTFIHFVFVWMFAVIVAGMDDSPGVFTRCIKGLMIWGLIVAIFGVYQQFARVFDLPLAWLDVTNVSVYYSRDALGLEGQSQIGQLSLKYSNFFRATSIFSEPSILAAYMSYLLAFLAAPYIQNQQPFFRNKALNWIMLAFFSGVTFLTFSMTAFASVGALLAVLFLLERGKRLKRVLYALLSLLAFIAVVDTAIKPLTKVSVIELFGKRVVGFFDFSDDPYKVHFHGESVELRVKSLSTAVDIWEEYPITGIGVGRYWQADIAKERDVEFAISTYFSVLAETGAPGIIIFMGMLSAIGWMILYWFKRKNEFDVETARHLGIFPYLFILLLLHNFTGNSFSLSGLWIYLGIIFAVFNSVRKSQGRSRFEFRLVDVPLKTLVTHSKRGGEVNA